MARGAGRGAARYNWVRTTGFRIIMGSNVADYEVWAMVNHLGFLGTPLVAKYRVNK